LVDICRYNSEHLTIAALIGNAIGFNFCTILKNHSGYHPEKQKDGNKCRNENGTVLRYSLKPRRVTV